MFMGMMVDPEKCHDNVKIQIFPNTILNVGEPTNTSIKKESMNMHLPNPYTLIAGSLLIVLALTQYFAIRSENALYVAQISDLQQQLRNA